MKGRAREVTALLGEIEGLQVRTLTTTSVTVGFFSGGRVTLPVPSAVAGGLVLEQEVRVVLEVVRSAPRDMEIQKPRRCGGVQEVDVHLTCERCGAKGAYPATWMCAHCTFGEGGSP